MPSPSNCSDTTIARESTPTPQIEPIVKDESTADPYLVKFEHSDPLNPKNWSKLRRWYLTIASGVLVLNATFASSAPAGILQPLARELGMSHIAGVLTISLFVAGYCVGPLLWGPLSEHYGRRPVFIYTFIVYTVFQIAAAVARNTASLLVFRFLGGVFAAAPLTNSGALISDIWDAKTRGKALAIFTVAPFAGPALGPTAAGFLGEHTTWRWLFWLLAIFAGLCWIMIVLTIPETYSPVLLVRKAQRKRIETKDDSFYAPMEKDVMTVMQRAEHVLARPFVIFFQEPMLIALTTYISFVYGCTYLLFQAYPVVFTQGHHFSAGVSSLMFLPIPIGGTVAVISYVLVFNPGYEREVERCAPEPVPPEFRLGIALIAGPLFAASFFWFAWTSPSDISFWVPMTSGLLMGFSSSWIFLGLLNYIVDAYISVAASALASNTVIRSLCGAAFPLFTTKMYASLGPRWASSLVGFVAISMIPIPLVLQRFVNIQCLSGQFIMSVLRRYGPTLRRKSKYAPTQETTPPDKKQNAPRNQIVTLYRIIIGKDTAYTVYALFNLSSSVPCFMPKRLEAFGFGALWKATSRYDACYNTLDVNAVDSITRVYVPVQ
ncbi:major facilitator superfamily domain-containing protein [Lyophyllum atratum]|nr:major facilitator superfamily domain-containing protein [Lyophyllum atratum]